MEFTVSRCNLFLNSKINDLNLPENELDLCATIKGSEQVMLKAKSVNCHKFDNLACFLTASSALSCTYLAFRSSHFKVLKKSPIYRIGHGEKYICLTAGKLLLLSEWN